MRNSKSALRGLTQDLRWPLTTAGAWAKGWAPNGEGMRRDGRFVGTRTYLYSLILNFSLLLTSLPSDVWCFHEEYEKGRTTTFACFVIKNPGHQHICASIVCLRRRFGRWLQIGHLSRDWGSQATWTTSTSGGWSFPNTSAKKTAETLLEFSSRYVGTYGKNANRRTFQKWGAWTQQVFAFA